MDLPKSLISEHIICRGTILLSDCFTDINHSKFFVIIGVYQDTYVGLFFINSAINLRVNTTVEQSVILQYPILCKDYSFLTHDSYISATKVRTLSKADIMNDIDNGKTLVKGVLLKRDIEMLLNIVRSSDLFTPQIKRQFFY